MIALAHSCDHLKPFFPAKTLVSYELLRFSDGEIAIQLDQDMNKKNVWVVAATNCPADHFFELMFLLDALERAGATFKVLLTYFGYGRQDRFFQGQSLSSEVLFRCLRQFRIKRTIIIHAHSVLLHLYFDFENLILFDFFSEAIASADILIAPDAGAARFVSILGKMTHKPVIVLEKKRSHAGEVSHQKFNSDLKNKNVCILDDMISSGSTIVSASKLLAENGARSIKVAATHGLMTEKTVDLLMDSPITHVYVTNTIAQRVSSPKITVINCAPLLEHILMS